MVNAPVRIYITMVIVVMLMCSIPTAILYVCKSIVFELEITWDVYSLGRTVLCMISTTSWVTYILSFFTGSEVEVPLYVIP